jgi:DnaJ-class molecular chaperone
MRDPYDVLGVPKGASAADIKSAFRKQAKKLHPDANKHDPKAASRFAELNAAYEILGEDDKRKAFDRGEIDAEGKPRFQGFGAGQGPQGGFGQGGNHEGGFETFSWGTDGFQRAAGGAGGSFEDLLKEAFGGRGRSARGARPGGGFRFEQEDLGGGQDIAAALTITLPEAAKGVKKRIVLPTGKEVDVKIPAGMVDGKQIRLKGQGLPGPGSIGDALITIKIAPHALFERDGANLRTNVPITLYAAVLGGKVRVPTLGGAVELAIPAGTSGGRTFRLKGKGMPVEGKTGDLFATVSITLPEQGDPELEELMKKWREQKPYDPRRDPK